MSLQETNEGYARGQEGMERVTAGNPSWQTSALEKIKELPVTWTGSGEAIRFAVGTQPSHHNAWGVLINAALKANLIFPTGDYTRMKSKTSNGRKTPIYERM